MVSDDDKSGIRFRLQSSSLTQDGNGRLTGKLELYGRVMDREVWQSVQAQCQNEGFYLGVTDSFQKEVSNALSKELAVMEDKVREQAREIMVKDIMIASLKAGILPRP